MLSRCLFIWVLVFSYGGLKAQVQEGGGQAEAGFQQYYLAIGQQRVANISGLTLSYNQFLPDIGLLSASLAPAMSNNQFRTGDDYLRLKGLPWLGQHWTIGIGDFHLPGQLLPVSFTNLYFPQIAGRGASVEVTHGGRTMGFFYGTGTIANTPRVVLRMAVPQTVAGLYLRQKIGSRLVLGARVMHFSNDLAALQSLPYLLTQNSHLKSATTASVDGLYTIAGPLKWYGEATWSMSDLDVAQPARRNVPVSTLAGPLLDTKFLTVRANYTLQNDSYFPLLGYYLGDRRGPFGEATVRPFRGLEIYGSASQYENNVARDPQAPTFRNSSESAGASIQLPARFSLNGQITFLDLATRQDATSPWVPSRDRQRTINLARPIFRQNLLLTVRDFKQDSAIAPQRLRSGEIEDTFHIKRLSMGAGARIQRLISADSRTTVYYHGFAQFHLKRFTAYANIETGNDLQNRTLFATNAVSTTIVGASLTLGKGWELQGEGYRNNLIAELNPQSIFVLQGQGVFIPGALSTLNQWSVYFHVTRRFSWGKAALVSDSTGVIVREAPLKGSVEGFVMERFSGGNRPAEGVVVSLDQGRTMATDSSGHFRFADVPEGMHKVALAIDELLADYDPGTHKETAVSVYPNKPSRTDLDVLRLFSIRGKVIGPPNTPLEGIAIRLAPTQRYTTPDGDGNFSFYNLREGDYTVAVDEKTLPPTAVLEEPRAISVSVGVIRQLQAVVFRFQVPEPEKSVRKIFEKKIEAPPAVRIPNAPASPAPPKDLPEASPAPPVPAPGPAPANVAPAKVPPAKPAAAPIPAEKHNLAGRALMQAGRYMEAIAEFNEAIRNSPDFALAYNARGYAWYLLRKYDAAIADLDAAIRINPSYANAYEIRAWVKRAEGDLTASAADLRRAHELTR